MEWATYISDSRVPICAGAGRAGPAETRDATASRATNDSIVAAWWERGVAVTSRTVCLEQAAQRPRKAVEWAWCLGIIYSNVAR